MRQRQWVFLLVGAIVYAILMRRQGSFRREKLRSHSLIANELTRDRSARLGLNCRSIASEMLNGAEVNEESLSNIPTPQIQSVDGVSVSTAAEQGGTDRFFSISKLRSVLDDLKVNEASMSSDLLGIPLHLSRQGLTEKSKKLLEDLPPSPVFTLFARILEIPRPSFQEDQLRNFVRQMAVMNGWWHRTDSAGNLLIRKEGWDPDVAGVCLQAHMDMVTIADTSSTHNFSTDGIDAYVDNGWLRANGTTLGADNGIGVAVALSMLLDSSIRGPIEVLLTTNEESGMTGARGLSAKWLRSNVLINLDSEEAGRITRGCAGSFSKVLSWVPKREIPEKKMHYISMRISNLTGGHSGLMIHRKIPNAINVAARCLLEVMNEGNIPLQVVSFDGGDSLNSIPTRATAWLAVEKSSQVKKACDIIQSKLSLLQAEELSRSSRSLSDDDLLDPTTKARTWELEIREENRRGKTNHLLTKEDSRKFAEVLLRAPQGYIDVSRDGHVDSSVLLSKAHLDSQSASQLDLSFKARLSAELDEQKIDEYIADYGRLNDLDPQPMRDFYRGWTAPEDTIAVRSLRRAYRRVFKQEPEMQKVHGGLELGLIANKYPNVFCASVGAEILGAHTTQERLRISSVEHLSCWLKKAIELMHHSRSSSNSRSSH